MEMTTARTRAHEQTEVVAADREIGTLVFNVGWWIDYPPMVFAGVLLAAAGLDLWIH